MSSNNNIICERIKSDLQVVVTPLQFAMYLYNIASLKRSFGYIMDSHNTAGPILNIEGIIENACSCRNNPFHYNLFPDRKITYVYNRQKIIG
ncbi:hypothetical protein D3C84_1126550 [compost metagenome]